MGALPVFRALFIWEITNPCSKGTAIHYDGINLSFFPMGNRSTLSYWTEPRKVLSHGMLSLAGKETVWEANPSTWITNLMGFRFI